MTRTCVVLLATLLLTATVSGAEPALQVWTVDGVERQGLVYVPESAKSKAAPVVFVFHGHGGTMRNAARQFHLHDLWPEAICVYLQGLNTPGQLTDPQGKKSGWQRTPGDQGDRDLKLFDTVLAALKTTYTIDENRIYSTGHSNGGGFTYLLWATRGDVLAAVAPSAAAAAKTADLLKPKPVLHLAGAKDPLVKFEWQAAMMTHLRKLNGCAIEGKKEGDLLTVYPSATGTPVATYIHPGGHQFTPDSPAVIVKFLKAYTKPAK